MSPIAPNLLGQRAADRTGITRGVLSAHTIFIRNRGSFAKDDTRAILFDADVKISDTDAVEPGDRGD